MEPAKLTFEFEEPDVSHLITEDDEPVDNPFSEKQQRMPADSLHASWTKEMREGRPFVAFANVGLFFVPKNPALVPDVQVGLDVELPEDLWEKKNRSYLTWVYGKPPDIVLEIVSNTKGGETDRKFKTYAEQAAKQVNEANEKLEETSRQAQEAEERAARLEARLKELGEEL